MKYLKIYEEYTSITYSEDVLRRIAYNMLLLYVPIPDFFKQDMVEDEITYSNALNNRPWKFFIVENPYISISEEDYNKLLKALHPYVRKNDNLVRDMLKYKKDPDIFKTDGNYEIIKVSKLSFEARYLDILNKYPHILPLIETLITGKLPRLEFNRINIMWEKI